MSGTCECDLRNRRWNPNTGRCESCGRRYEQPRPIPNDSTPIVDLVIADLRERAEVGRERYGMYLQAGNGRDPTQDAYEEVLDLAKYIRLWREDRRALVLRIANLEREVSTLEGLLVGHDVDAGDRPARYDIASLLVDERARVFTPEGIALLEQAKKKP